MGNFLFLISIWGGGFQWKTNDVILGLVQFYGRTKTVVLEHSKSELYTI